MGYQSYLEVALKAAESGAKELLRHWKHLKDIRMKGGLDDLVTEADRASEEAIVTVLKSHFKEHAILAEERGAQGDSSFVWVIDPLDGTLNYVHHFPLFAVSIGLLEQGKPIVGVVLNPITNECFYAMKGSGAWKNGERLSVSDVKSLDQAILSTGFPSDRRTNPDNNYHQFFAFSNACQGVRRLGAAALDFAYVASGALDGYWEGDLCPWDMAAGVLLVEEAGGKVTNYAGEPVDLYANRVVASNKKIHSLLITALQTS